MRTVSTGVGLCVLGVCVLGAAALSSPRLGNAAIAAGGAQRSSLPATAIRPEPNPMQRNPMPSNSSLTDCEVRVEHWFSPTPHLIRDCEMAGGAWCAASPYAPQDILGDGNARSLASIGGVLVLPVNDAYQFLEVRNFTQMPDGTTSVERIAILSSADADLLGNLGALLLQNGCNDAWVNIDSGSNGGLVDMDGDGDLDVMFSFRVAQDDVFTFHRGWLENIKGDAVRPNPYDHDGDGHVNTSDLSLLLMEFTD